MAQQESTTVASLVERLQQIKRDVPEAETDTATQVLMALEQVVHDSQQTLEAKSITASSLRHRLSNLKCTLETELEAAVRAVRSSSLKTSLEEELNRLLAEATRYETKMDIIHMHSDVLRHENETLAEKYKNAQASLNSTLSLKASLLQYLTETRMKTSEAYKAADALERETVQLKATLVAEKQKSEQENNEMQTEMTQINKDMMARQALMHKKKMELCYLQEELSLAKSNNAEKQKSLQMMHKRMEECRQMEHNWERECRSLKAEIDKEKRRGVDIVKQKNEVLERLQKTLEETSQRVPGVAHEIELAEKEKAAITEQNRALRKELKGAEAELEAQTQNLTEAQERVSKMKKTLLFQAEESARLCKESKELEKKLAQLEESHKVTVDMFKSQMEHVRTSLAYEKKSRLETEATYTRCHAKSEAERTRKSQIIQELSGKVNNSKRRTEALSAEELDYIASTQHLMAQSEELEEELSKATIKHEECTVKCEEEHAILKEDLAVWKENAARKQAEFLLLQPEYEELIAKMSQSKDLYEAKQQETIEMKTKESELKKAIHLKEMMHKSIMDQKSSSSSPSRTILWSVTSNQGCTQKSIAHAKALVLQEIRDAQSKVEDAQRRDWEVRVKLERSQIENQKFTKRMAELQKDNDGMESVEKLKGAHGPQLSTRCSKLTAQLKSAQEEQRCSVKECCAQYSELLSNTAKLEESLVAHQKWVAEMHAKMVHLDAR